MNGIISLDHDMIQKSRMKDLVMSEKGVSNALLTKTDMIYRVPLKNGQRVYDNININDNGTLVFPERKLMDGHLFVPMYAAYFLAKVSVNQAGTVIYKSNYPWHTFPDPNVFTDAPVGNVKEVDCLNALYYGGSLSIKVDGTEALREVSGHHFLSIPERPFTSAAASGEANDLPQQFGPSLEQRGYYRLDNEVVLKGGEDNKLVLKLGEGNVNNLEGGNDDPNTRNELFIAFHGLWYFGESLKSGFCSLR